MNCQAVQNQILDLPDPRQLPAELAAHARACPVCRAWARQAARLEALVEHLPAPAAVGDKKELLLAELMSGGPALATPAARGGTFEFLQRNASYIGGLAAAVLVALGAYALWPTAQKQPDVVARPPQKHPLLDKVVAGNTLLARADTPKRRLEVLGGMAGDIAADTRGMARVAGAAELRQMAGWYDEVVAAGMVRQADRLSASPTENAADRERFLNEMADKLRADAAEAEKLSREVPQDAQPVLRRMADTARAAEQSLRKGK
jgi:hypothetical protein